MIDLLQTGSSSVAIGDLSAPQVIDGMLLIQSTGAQCGDGNYSTIIVFICANDAKNTDDFAGDLYTSTDEVWP